MHTVTLCPLSLVNRRTSSMASTLKCRKQRKKSLSATNIQSSKQRKLLTPKQNMIDSLLIRKSSRKPRSFRTEILQKGFECNPATPEFNCIVALKRLSNMDKTKEYVNAPSKAKNKFNKELAVEMIHETSMSTEKRLPLSPNKNIMLDNLSVRKSSRKLPTRQSHSLEKNREVTPVKPQFKGDVQLKRSKRNANVDVDNAMHKNAVNETKDKCNQVKMTSETTASFSGLKENKERPLTLNEVTVDSLSVQKTFRKSYSLRRHVLEKTLEFTTEIPQFNCVVQLDKSKTNENFFNERKKMCDAKLLSSVEKAALISRRSVPKGKVTKHKKSPKSDPKTPYKDFSKTFPLDDLCIRSLTNPKSRKKNKFVGSNIPGKNTLKRKRWMFNELNRLNADYEDDIFENRNFDHFKDIFPDSPSQLSYSVSTPKLEFQATPIFRKQRSPIFKDCISPTQYALSRKVAEECMYKRHKRNSSLKNVGDSPKCKRSSKGNSVAEKKRLQLSDVMLEITKKQKEIEALRGDEETDMENSYFSDC